MERWVHGSFALGEDIFSGSIANYPQDLWFVDNFLSIRPEII